jgi:hypothetical protein
MNSQPHWIYWREGDELRRWWSEWGARPARAIEARRAATGTGAVADESAVAESHAPKGAQHDHP